MRFLGTPSVETGLTCGLPQLMQRWDRDSGNAASGAELGDRVLCGPRAPYLPQAQPLLPGRQRPAQPTVGGAHHAPSSGRTGILLWPLPLPRSVALSTLPQCLLGRGNVPLSWGQPGDKLSGGRRP